MLWVGRRVVKGKERIVIVINSLGKRKGGKVVGVGSVLIKLVKLEFSNFE